MHKLFTQLLIGIVLSLGWVGGIFAIDYTLDDASRVFDRAEVLDDTVEDEIEEKLLTFEEQTIGQIVLITLPKLQSRPIEEIALRFGRENGIGDGEKNTGLIVLVAIEERQWRIEVGYGLEGLITDQQAYHLGQDILVPAFRAGDYTSGFENLSDELIAILQGEKELAKIDESQYAQTITLGQVFFFGVFAALFFGAMIGSGKPSMMTKNIISGLGSGITGLFGILVSSWWGLLIAIPLYFIWKAFISADWQSSGRSYRGRSMRGGSFSGGGFSGFGGGSFGGGGASGSR